MSVRVGLDGRVSIDRLIQGHPHRPAHTPIRLAPVMRPGGAYAGWYTMDRSIGDGAERHLDCWDTGHDFYARYPPYVPVCRDAAPCLSHPAMPSRSPAPPWPRSSKGDPRSPQQGTHSPTQKPNPFPTPTGYVGGPTMAVIASNCPHIRVCVVDISVPQIQVR